MGALVLIFALSIIIIAGSVALSDWFFRLDNQKKYVAAGGTPVSAMRGKKVTWKSGNPTPWSVTSKGYDVTDTLVTHGAKPIPDKGRYLYFPLLVLRNAEYDTLTIKHENVLCIEIDGLFYAKINVNPTAADPAKELLRAARSGYGTFYRKWEKVLKQREFEDFVAGRTKKNSLPVIGEPTEWVED